MTPFLRAKRRHRLQAGHSAKLSLVSLMDIFTILVFFLMLNTSDIQVLDAPPAMQLPRSDSEVPTRETLVLVVTPQQLLLQGETVLRWDAWQDDASPLLTPLLNALQGYQQDAAAPLAITLMGESTLPYAWLKKVLATCSVAGVQDLSLAVEPVP